MSKLRQSFSIQIKIGLRPHFVGGVSHSTDNEGARNEQRTNSDR